MKKHLSIALIIFFAISSLLSDIQGDFFPGQIIINISHQALGNTRGNLEISTENGIIHTSLDWLNNLATEYEITHLERMFYVKNADWHNEGRYPMNTFRLITGNLSRTNDLITRLSAQNEITYAEPEAINRLFFDPPDDPQISSQWHLEKINAFEAWALSTGENIIVGVADSGTKWNHSDLRDNIYINLDKMEGMDINWTMGSISGDYGMSGNNIGGGVEFWGDIMGWDFHSEGSGLTPPQTPPNNTSNNPFQTRLGQNHGTHVAGTIGAVAYNNNAGVGVAFGSKLLTTKHSPFDTSTTTVYNAYHGIYYLVDAGVKVINCSWGGVGFGGTTTAHDAIAYAMYHGVLVVAAAGNSNSDLAVRHYLPASAPGVVCVAATDISDLRSLFTGNQASNYGVRVDVSAPGSAIWASAFSAPGNDIYTFMSGTSMASPVVAAVAALVFSRNPGLTPAEVRDILRAATDPIDHLNPGYEGMLGTGRINAHTAVLMAVQHNYDLVIRDLKGPEMVYEADDIIFNVYVRNNGFEFASGYTINLFREGDNVPIATTTGSMLEFTEHKIYEMTWKADVIGWSSLYATLVWNDDQDLNNNITEIHKLIVLPNGMENIQQGNPHTAFSDNTAMFNFTQNRSITQTIYHEEDLMPGTIYRMRFRYTGAQELVTSEPEIKFYLAITDKNFFENTNDWLPYSEFTEVYSGTWQPTVIGAQTVEFILDNPYVYKTGNLVLLAIKDDEATFGSGNVFTFTPFADQIRSIFWASNAQPISTQPFPPASDIKGGYTNVIFSILPHKFDIPRDLSANVLIDSIYLEWLAPIITDDFGVFTGYFLYRDDQIITGLTVNSYLDQNVEIDTQYVYSVRAIYDLGVSDPISVTVVFPAHYPPTNLHQVDDANKIGIAWDAPITANYDTLISYIIIRDDDFYAELEPDVLEFSDTNVEFYVVYTYTIEAIYESGSSYSNSIEAMAISVSIEDDPTIVYTTALQANYPNPFNPETSIRFSLENDSNVVIELFNIRGQKVTTLVDDYKEKGNHVINWNAENMASGVYFYRMSTENYTNIRRMVLMK